MLKTLQFQELAVGSKIDVLKGIPDSHSLNLDSLPAIYTAYSNLTPKEIKQFKSDFELRLINKNGVMYGLLKFGSMPWSEFVYHPLYHNQPPTLPDITGNEGYLLNLVLVESTTGIIKHMRFVSLNSAVSRELNKIVTEQIADGFNMHEYNQKINTINARYTTDELAQQATARCKIRR